MLLMMMIIYVSFNAIIQLNSRTTHFWKFINMNFFNCFDVEHSYIKHLYLYCIYVFG
jgi:hypothetical protein